MSVESRFGEPVELAWWVVALGALPVLVAVAGVFVGAPLWARVLDVSSGVATLWLLARISMRVESRSMQSVWASLLLAVWFSCAMTWLAAALSAGH